MSFPSGPAAPQPGPPQPGPPQGARPGPGHGPHPLPPGLSAALPAPSAPPSWASGVPGGPGPYGVGVPGAFPPAPPRAPGRPWWSRAGTVGAVTAGMFGAAGAVAYASQARGSGSTMAGVDQVAMLLGLIAAGFLVARRRFAVPLTLAAAALAVVLPLDSVTALIALPWVFATASRRTAWWCTGAVGVATGVALWRDWSRPVEHRVLSVTDQVTGQISGAGLPLVVVIGVLCLGASVAAGLVRASRAQTARAVADMEGQTARADTLRDRMTRQEERELIAREVHDTVAHHISLISLQASALEVQRGAGDAQVQAAARQVRSSAQQAIAEMRGLITTLRDGDEAQGPGATLDDLAGLLDGARRQGRWVTSSVFVTDGRGASPALTRATFRIVQEGLTNALKHAPGQPVEVTVRAAPGDGVRVRVQNPLLRGAAPASGTGTGLVGMRERAGLLGGTVDARTEGGWHVLEASLPWSASSPDGEALRSGV